MYFDNIYIHISILTININKKYLQVADYLTKHLSIDFTQVKINIVCKHGMLYSYYQHQQPKLHNLFRTVENKIEQRFAAHIVQCCQKYCSALLNLNQPAIRYNNAEQYC